MEKIGIGMEVGGFLSPMLGILSQFLGKFQLVNAVKKSFRTANTTPTPLWVQFPSV